MVEYNFQISTFTQKKLNLNDEDSAKIEEGLKSLLTDVAKSQNDADTSQLTADIYDTI